MEDFASILVSARQRTGKTQAQVAIAAGLTPSYLSFLENRKKPPPSDDVCRRLAVVLGIPARRLIEVSHLQRAPETVRKEVRSLRSTLKRERRSRLRVLKNLLSPFLFSGPPGFLEAALDTLRLSSTRRRKLREALSAVGRHRQDQAEEVARIVDELPERERNKLLQAIPKVLEEQAPSPTGEAQAPEPDPMPTVGPADPQASDSPPPGVDSELPLLYAPPEGEGAPAGAYLLSVDDTMAAEAEDLRAGELLVVDPRLVPEPGDLLVMRGDGGGTILRRLEAVGERFRLALPSSGPGRPGAEERPLLARPALNELLAGLGAGTVIEVRRPLRRRGG